MDDELILESLRKRLVATIGTNGTIKGCTVDQTISDFSHDWNENLLDYVKYFKHQNLIDLIKKRLFNYIRIDYTKGVHICAVASKELSHLFDLINSKRPKEMRINKNVSARTTQIKASKKQNNSNEMLNLASTMENKLLFTPTPIYIRKSTLVNLITKNKEFNSLKIDLLKIMKCDSVLIYDKINRKTFVNEDFMNYEIQDYYKSLTIN